MDIRTRADYDHGPNEVFAVLTDPDFVAATVNQMSVGGQSHQVTTRGDHTVVTTRRTLPTDDLPDVAKKFAGPVLILDEVQDWGPAGPDGARHGTVTLRIDGVPVALTGTLDLTPSAKGPPRRSGPTSRPRSLIGAPSRRPPPQRSSQASTRSPRWPRSGCTADGLLLGPLSGVLPRIVRSACARWSLASVPPRCPTRP